AAGITALVGSRHLPRWEWTTPGAGLYPTVLGVGLLVCSALAIVGMLGATLVGRAGPSGRPSERGSAPDGDATGAESSPRSSLAFALFGLTCLGWALSLKWLGFTVSCSVAGSIVAWVLEPRSGAKAIVVGALGAFVAAWLFSSLPGMQLP
ncbi:MAG: tripartite tricarboxylate transporter TctB family protein, partial [Firmicutes bacterium]|nr:tripartite tricarboxylate transporter TctB family protein [Bacillota bacterium]